MPKRYHAFISYSHAADEKLAARLEKGLEQLGKTWRQRRALEIFRDQTALSSTPDLGHTLRQHLDASDYLILLLSPASASSKWVGEEIEHFLASKDRERILIALTEGELRWDGGRKSWTAHSTAPKVLSEAFDSEPFWVDLRWFAKTPDVDLRHSRFRDAVATLAAPIHGIPKDELEGEDVRAHRQAMVIRRAVTAAILVLLAGLAAVGWFARSERALKKIARAAAAKAICAIDDQEILKSNFLGQIDDLSRYLTVYRELGERAAADASSVSPEEWQRAAAHVGSGPVPAQPPCEQRAGYPFEDRWAAIDPALEWDQAIQAD